MLGPHHGLVEGRPGPSQKLITFVIANASSNGSRLPSNVMCIHLQPEMKLDAIPWPLMQNVEHLQILCLRLMHSFGVFFVQGLH